MTCLLLGLDTGAEFWGELNVSFLRKFLFLQSRAEKEFLWCWYLSLTLQACKVPLSRQKSRCKKEGLIHGGPRLRHRDIRKQIREEIGTKTPVDMGHTAIAALSQGWIDQRAKAHPNKAEFSVLPILFNT